MKSCRTGLFVMTFVVLGARGAAATVVETIGDVSGAPGGIVPVSVTMDDGGAGVVGIQLDLGWDSATPVAATPGMAPDCAVNPAIHKDQTAFAFQPFGCTPGVDCTAVRALVISFVDPSPIPSGSVLVTCNLAIAADAPGGIHPLPGTNCAATDAGATSLPTTCTDGSVTVNAAAASLVTGKSLALAAKPTHPTSNAAVYASKDATLPLPAAPAEDPRCAPLGSGAPDAGATLRVVGAVTDFTIALPCANWSLNRAGNRLTYRDRSHATCESIAMKSGNLKAVCKGAQVAANLGTAQGDVAVVLTTGGSATPRQYCASFGPATGARVVKDGSDGRRFVARDAGAPVSCPP